MSSIFFDNFFFFIYYDAPNFMPKQEKTFSKIRWHMQNVGNLYDHYFFIESQPVLQ